MRAAALLCLLLASCRDDRVPSGVECQDLASCRAACDRGDSFGCERAAGMAEKESELDLAMDLYARACEGGRTKGCLRAGRRLFLGLLVERDDARALPLLEKACSDGAGLACEDLSDAYAWGRSVPIDPARAKSYDVVAAKSYEVACDGQDFPACTRRGIFFETGRAGLDLKKAVNYLDASCKNWDIAGCGALGQLYLDGRGVKRDEDRAADLLQRTCDEVSDDSPWACIVLAELAVAGKAPKAGGAKGPYAKARKVLAKDCVEGRARTCAPVARLELAGLGGAVDERRARQHLEAGCARRAPESCALLGRLDTGAPVGLPDGPGDQPLVDALRLDCERGFIDSCDRLAETLAYGLGVPADPEAAIEPRRTSCTVRSWRCEVMGSPAPMTEVGDQDAGFDGGSGAVDAGAGD